MYILFKDSHFEKNYKKIAIQDLEKEQMIEASCFFFKDLEKNLVEAGTKVATALMDLLQQSKS